MPRGRSRGSTRRFITGFRVNGQYSPFQGGQTITGDPQRVRLSKLINQQLRRQRVPQGTGGFRINSNAPSFSRSGGFRRGGVGGFGNNSLRDQAIAAANEAKQQTLAAKSAALGAFGFARGRIAGRENALNDIHQFNQKLFNPLAGQLEKLDPNIINDQEKQALIANRKANLAATTQNTASLFSDADSGIQSGRRINIAQQGASAAANLPIDIELDVQRTNRGSALDLIRNRANIAGQIANVNNAHAGNLLALNSADLGIASGISGVQQSFQFDPGSQFFNQAGFAQGNAPSPTNGFRVGGAGSASTGSFASRLNAARGGGRSFRIGRGNHSSGSFINTRNRSRFRRG